MVSHHSRSALNLGGAAASIIGASLGMEEVSSTTATLKTPEAAPLSERKCTCKGITPTPPPCYSCTFNLQHSPPPYRNKNRSKLMRTGSQTFSTDSSNWGSIEVSEENSQCRACEEASSSSASDQIINLDPVPDTQNQVSSSVVTNEPDNSTESVEDINLTNNDPRTTDGRSAYYQAGARPKLVLNQTRARSRTAGAPRCETIQESGLLATQETPSQSNNVYVSDPLVSSVRERLGSVSVFRDNSFDHLTSRNAKLVTSNNTFESLCDTNGISTLVLPLSSSSIARDIPVTSSASTSSAFGGYQVGYSLQRDSSDDNSHHQTQTVSFSECAAAISNSQYESPDQGILSSTDDTPLPSQVVIPE